MLKELKSWKNTTALDEVIIKLIGKLKRIDQPPDPKEYKKFLIFRGN
jgi:hypothetical protein|tara:strand:- start:120 stop:260 length:141 start_codon:yes stop_codon:yes gene_type:complete